MKQLSEEMKYLRRNMIGHILRQDPNDCNDEISWAQRKKEKRKAKDNMVTSS